ncbi:MAG TPA: NTP transferase domain-containing protein [Pyrinomonadaceae bacterium]
MALTGIIPAAGKASRMGELSLPKALIEVEGRTLLERSIESLKSIGVSKIVVVVGHLEDQLLNFMSTHDFGVEVRTAHQQQPLGLAHAISTALDQIDSDFVVLCPDNIYTDETDLARAKEIFNERKPAFMLLATVTPNKQRDRKSYFIAGRRNLDANIYGYNSDASSGLAINSTGCVFFKREALDYLPSFAGTTREHIFRDYLESIANQRDALIYLLRGMRYDFSEPADIEDFVKLKRALSNTAGRGVSAILMNSRGQALLQQRDDNPAIRYPGHWSLFGGTVENDETPAAAVAREVKEELDFDMRNFGLFREFVQNNKHEFAFVGELSAEPHELTLSEGQAMNLFDPSQLQELLIRPDDQETLREYFGA